VSIRASVNSSRFGYAVENVWYEYEDNWYYLGADCAMATGLRVIDRMAYFFHEEQHGGSRGEGCAGTGSGWCVEIIKRRAS